MKSFQFLLPNKQNYVVWLSAINLLIGVFFWKWRTEAIIFAFLWETAVLGILHIFKLYGTLIGDKPNGEHSKRPQKYTDWDFRFLCLY